MLDWETVTELQDFLLSIGAIKSHLLNNERLESLLLWLPVTMYLLTDSLRVEWVFKLHSLIDLLWFKLKDVNLSDIYVKCDCFSCAAASYTLGYFNFHLNLSYKV